MPGLEKPDSDSDLNEEFEDVPFQHPTSNGPNSTNPATSASIGANAGANSKWTPILNLPPQNKPPTPGSEEETQLRGRVSNTIDRISYRQMKTEMGMDAPDLHVSHRRYEGFEEFAGDVDGLVDLLWGSASSSLLTEALITLAGITETALPTYPFNGPAVLSLLHKFDKVFVALCTGVHPVTGESLVGGNSIVTQTQKVRIRSLAETTRVKVFGVLPDDEELEGGTDGGGGGGGGGGDEGWVLEVTRVYEGVLMLLGDQGDM